MAEYASRLRALPVMPIHDGDHACWRSHAHADNILAIKEGRKHVETDHWHPIVIEMKVNDDKSLKTVRRCEVEYALPAGDKKGFEGAEYIDGGERGEFLLGLCEGNFCEVCHFCVVFLHVAAATRCSVYGKRSLLVRSCRCKRQAVVATLLICSCTNCRCAPTGVQHEDMVQTW